MVTDSDGSRKNVARENDPARGVFKDFEDQLMRKGRSLSRRFGENVEKRAI